MNEAFKVPSHEIFTNILALKTKSVIFYTGADSLTW
jgi:hypothetical protein